MTLGDCGVVELLDLPKGWVVSENVAGVGERGKERAFLLVAGALCARGHNFNEV